MSWRPSVSLNGTRLGQPRHSSSDSRYNNNKKQSLLSQSDDKKCICLIVVCPLTCFGFTLECHNRQTLSCICQGKITICFNSLDKDQILLDKCNIRHIFNKVNWTDLTVVRFCLTGHRLTGVGSKTWHVVSSKSNSRRYVSGWPGYTKRLLNIKTLFMPVIKCVDWYIDIPSVQQMNIYMKHFRKSHETAQVSYS